MSKRNKPPLSRRAQRLTGALVWAVVGFLVVVALALFVNGGPGWLIAGVVVAVIFAWLMDRKWVADNPEEE